jgi:hypothetical protein
MKNKLILSLTCLAVSTTLLISCLKDKGFDNYEYGIKDPSGSPKGVSFPLAVKGTNVFGLDAFSTTNQVVSDIIVVNSESGVLPTTDVKVQIAVDQSLVTAYNLANVSTPGFTKLAILNSSLYSLSSNTVVIPAGKLNGQISINVPSSVPLALDSSYGLAIKIVSVDNGYTIAQNLKTIIVEFNIKNKYDGKYKLNGVHTRPTYPFPFTGIKMNMVTSGATSVKFYVDGYGINDFGHPIGTAPGVIGWYGNTVAPVLVFNGATNAIVNAFNADATSVPISIYTGPGSGPGRYDPVTKTIYAYFRYNANDARAWLDTLTYVGPR